MEPLGSEWSSEALLWFQTLVDSKQLSARVLTVTTEGHGLELESRGQNVAAALVSEQLAKVPGEIPNNNDATTRSDKCDNSAKKIEPNQPAFNQTGASSKEMPTEEQPATPSEGQLECLPSRTIVG